LAGLVLPDQYESKLRGKGECFQMFILISIIKMEHFVNPIVWIDLEMTGLNPSSD